MIYDVNHFIKKFKSIPEEKWITDKLQDGEGRCCAQGHCGVGRHDLSNLRSIPGTEAYALVELFGVIDDGYRIAFINNGDDPNYQQPTPKQRVLAALYDLKRQEQLVTEAQEIINESQLETV
jgi:hypothetical protein